MAEYYDRVRFVGRCTSDGRRDRYFYTFDGAWAETILSTCVARFSAYEFETGSRHDAEWQTYSGFLFPSERAMETIQNGRVLSALEKEGDHHDTVREVSHWIYFETEEARERFLTEIRRRGYREASRRDDADGSRPFGATIAGDTDVDYKTINNVTLELFDLARARGGCYDGWETSVERGEDPPDGTS